MRTLIVHRTKWDMDRANALTYFAGGVRRHDVEVGHTTAESVVNGGTFAGARLDCILVAEGVQLPERELEILKTRLTLGGCLVHL